MSQNRISIVVPIYNEENILPVLTQRICNTITKLPDFDWEVVYIDDGSSDCSLEVMKQLTRKYPWLRVLELSRNFGHQTAITAGIDHATGNAVVLMDGDLQDPPELISEMLTLWRNGFDVVTARRKRRPGESLFKRATAFGFYRLLKLLSDTNIPVDTGDFRLMSRTVVDALKHMPERSRFLRGMVSWTGFRQTELEYEREERLEGKTKYTFFKMIRLATNGLLSFSRVPLQTIMALGVLFSFASFAGILIVLYQTLILRTTVRGWSSLIIAVLFMGGIQLICLGTIGSYVGRIFDEVRARPLYFVRSFNGRTTAQKAIPFMKQEVDESGQPKISTFKTR